MSSIATEIRNLATKHAKQDAARRQKNELENQAKAQKRAEEDLADVKRRLEFIETESLKFGCTEKDPFWMRCATASWKVRPRISSNQKYSSQKLNTIVIDRGHSQIIIGLIKFSPLGGISGLVVRDFKQNVMFAYGELEDRFEENDRWAPMLANFHLLGEAKPAIF